MSNTLVAFDISIPAQCQAVMDAIVRGQPIDRDTVVQWLMNALATNTLGELTRYDQSVHAERQAARDAIDRYVNLTSARATPTPSSPPPDSDPDSDVPDLFSLEASQGLEFDFDIENALFGQSDTEFAGPLSPATPPSGPPTTPATATPSTFSPSLSPFSPVLVESTGSPLPHHPPLPVSHPPHKYSTVGSAACRYIQENKDMELEEQVLNGTDIDTEALERLNTRRAERRRRRAQRSESRSPVNVRSPKRSRSPNVWESDSDVSVASDASTVILSPSTV